MVGRSDDPLALTVDLPGGMRVSAMLHDPWQARHSADVEALLQADVQSLLDFRAPQTSTELLRARLRPAVLTQEAMQVVAPFAVGDWPIAGRLQVLLMLEADGRRRPVLPEERLRLGHRPLRAAVANLVDDVGNPTYTEVGQGVWRVVLDDKHESCMLLVAGLWDLLEEKFNDTLILAHPTSDLLLCAPAGDPVAMKALQEASEAAQEASSDPPACPSLLRWSQRRWHTVEPSRRCGVCAWTTDGTAARCPSCGTPLDEDRFLAWLVGCGLLGAGWIMIVQRVGVSLERSSVLEAVLAGVAFGAIGYGLSLARARYREPWRPVLRDTEANLLDRSVRVPLVIALALGWAYLPQLAPELLIWPTSVPPAIGAALLVRAWVTTILIVLLPMVFIYRHGARWLDPRPVSTLDERTPPSPS